MPLQVSDMNALTRIIIVQLEKLEQLALLIDKECNYYYVFQECSNILIRKSARIGERKCNCCMHLKKRGRVYDEFQKKNMNMFGEFQKYEQNQTCENIRLCKSYKCSDHHISCDQSQQLINRTISTDSSLNFSKAPRTLS
ncbi:unnamed protein product [Paramecium octaurelia]|uniref:Uncharacterized protein n=1 Tax=Paramecium octaurelia TaxID=43137 RepID=A0A8S1WXB0_PAROT|nr:unnamed protein product [Paramecium octaurelia]